MLLQISKRFVHVLFEVWQVVGIAVDRINDDNSSIIRSMNRTVACAQYHRGVMRFATLDARSLQVAGYSDVSFAMDTDLSWQLGYTI